MSFFFWLFFIIDALLLCLTVVGGKFRSGFGAGTDFNAWMTLALVIVLITGLGLKLAGKQKWMSLVVVILPLLAMLVMYLVEKKSAPVQ
jgi:hypothetical protein